MKDDLSTKLKDQDKMITKENDSLLYWIVFSFFVYFYLIEFVDYFIRSKLYIASNILTFEY